MTSAPRSRLVPVVVVALTTLVIVVMVALVTHSQGSGAALPLADAPRPVTAIEVQAGSYVASKRYVGTVQPWLASSVGPQLVSAYVEDVLVRPGAKVKKGDVLARLDCRHVQVAGRTVAEQQRAAKALEAASADESRRLTKLAQGGFASVAETEEKRAEAESRAAQAHALDQQLSGTTLQTEDCVLRAPFDGEVAERLADPGAFARPGAALLTVVDRSKVRVVSDVAEDDYAAVAPGAHVGVKLSAVGRAFTGTVSRRTPLADAATRTIRFELDVVDPQRTIPLGTTADLSLDVGAPQDASVLPLFAASVKGEKASVFVVEANVARRKTVKVLGEHEGQLYVERALAPGTLVVTQGRTTLADGDAVAMQKASKPPPVEGAMR